MAAVGHIFGVIQSAPLGGLWCSRCGYESLSAFGQADCTGTNQTGRPLDKTWTSDAATVAAAIVTLNTTYSTPDPVTGRLPPSPHPGKQW